MTHALVTGPIQGRIPHGDGFLDVTPDVIFLGSEEEVAAAADSIAAEHAARGSHPLQQECQVLNAHRDEFSDDTVKAHQAAHKALNKKVGL